MIFPASNGPDMTADDKTKKSDRLSDQEFEKMVGRALRKGKPPKKSSGGRRMGSKRGPRKEA